MVPREVGVVEREGEVVVGANREEEDGIQHAALVGGAAVVGSAAAERKAVGNEAGAEMAAYMVVAERTRPVALVGVAKVETRVGMAENLAEWQVGAGGLGMAD